MRPVRQHDIDTAYQFACDVVDMANALFKNGIWDPFKYDLIWETNDRPYDIQISVSILKKEEEKKNG